MPTKPDDKPFVSQETYVQLSRLAHESFEQRRSYEWKIHFGLWGAIAAVVFAATKEKIQVFHCPSEAITVGVILWISYLLHLIMVSRGHAIDKKKKHYYMAKAEGLSEPQNVSKIPGWVLKILWTIPYMVFTGSLIYLAINILFRIQAEGQLG